MTRAKDVLDIFAGGLTKYNSSTDDELLKVFRKTPKDPDARKEVAKRGLQDHPLIKGKMKEK